MSEEKKGMSRGCLIVMVIFAIILVIIIAMSIVCYMKRDSIMQWGVIQISDQMQKEISADLPEGLTQEEVDSAFVAFNEGVKDKKVDLTEMQSLSLMIQEILKDKKVDHDEGLRFMEAMKSAIEEKPVPIDTTM